MTDGQFHNGSYAISGGDIPCANYGVTDIPPGLVVLVDTANVMTASLPPGVSLPTAGGGVVGTFGITVDTLYALPASGKPKPGRVRKVGAYPVKANGAVTYGDYVQASDTAAKLGWVKLCGAATEQIGQALGTAADGEEVLVWIAQAKNA